MAMTKVKPQTLELEKKTKIETPKVKSFREVSKAKKRIPDRQELSDSVLKKFVAALNDAYPDWQIGERRSKVSVKAHYLAHVPDPNLRRSKWVRQIMEVKKVTEDEALMEFSNPLRAGYAFVLLNNGQAFYYHVESGELYRKD